LDGELDPDSSRVRLGPNETGVHDTDFV
jgi:hypothetical protein